MAKKKEEVVVAHNEALDTGPLNVKVDAPVPIQPQDIVIAEVDFNELLELEKAIRQTEEQFNKLSGNLKRLERDLDVYYNHEKSLNTQIDAKRKELIKRYKLEEARPWRIDINSRKVVYQD